MPTSVWMPNAKSMEDLALEEVHLQELEEVLHFWRAKMSHSATRGDPRGGPADLGNAQSAADLPGQQIRDLGMPGDRLAAVSPA